MKLIILYRVITVKVKSGSVFCHHWDAFSRSENSQPVDVSVLYYLITGRGFDDSIG